MLSYNRKAIFESSLNLQVRAGFGALQYPECLAGCARIEPESAVAKQQDNPNIYWLKGFSIFLVVFGHFYASTFVVPGFDVARRMVYLFHMPLFMAISGFLFELSPPLPLGALLAKKFQRLLVPYLTLSAVIWGAKSIAAALSFNLQRAITSADWVAVALYPHHGFAVFLWYLYTLFVIFVLVGILQKFRVPLWAMGLLALGARFMPLPREFCLNLVGNHWIYFVLGMALSHVRRREGLFRHGLLTVGVAAAWSEFAVLAWLAITGSGRAVHWSELAASLAGILASWLTSVHPTLNRSLWLRRLGRTSASIYLLHTLVMGLTRYLWEVQIGTGSVWAQALFFVSAIGLGVYVPMRLQETFFARLPWLSRLVLGTTVRK